MNKDLVAKYGVVFGHYDSRGGTAFVTIAEPTAKEVKAAMSFYNMDFFGYDEETDRANNAGVGRECDVLVDQLIRDGADPATQDYLYVARVYHREGTWPDGMRDLESDGFVLEEFEDGANHPGWTGGPQPPYISGTMPGQEGGPAYGSDEWKLANEPYHQWNEKYQLWLATPPYPVFNLEYVQVGELSCPEMPDHLKYNSFTQEEYEAKRAGVDKFYAEWEETKLKLARATALTEFGQAAVDIPRWDDDAFGFLVIR